MKIRRCPFCGEEDTLKVLQQHEIEERDYDKSSGYYAVICDFLIGGCGSVSGYMPNKEQAIEKWNTRKGR